jgi:hypothetical protein
MLLEQSFRHHFVSRTGHNQHLYNLLHRPHDTYNMNYVQMSRQRTRVLYTRKDPGLIANALRVFELNPVLCGLANLGPTHQKVLSRGLATSYWPFPKRSWGATAGGETKESNMLVRTFMHSRDLTSSLTPKQDPSRFTFIGFRCMFCKRRRRASLTVKDKKWDNG